MKAPSPWVLLGLVLLLGAAVHLPALRIDFLSEDYGLVGMVHDAGLEHSLETSFTKGYLDWVLPFYRPISAGLFVVEIGLFGTHPLGYHLVSLLLLLATAGMLSGAASRLLLKQRWLPLLFTLLAVALPALDESLAWTIAGQQELVAALWMAAALLLFLRGSHWSLLPALLAYGSKESAFGLAPFLMLLCLMLSKKERPPGWLSLAIWHLLLAGAAFVGRTLILGSFKLPYQQAGPWHILRWLPGQLAHFPRALAVSAGWAVSSFLLGLLLDHFLRSLWQRTAASLARRLWLALLPALALLALLGPLLSLPLSSIQAQANSRAFAPALLLGTVLLAALASQHRRGLGFLCTLLVLSVLGAGFEARQRYTPFRAMSREAGAGRRAIAALPGTHLLVAGLPSGLHWSYPAAAKPPFEKPGRTIFPLRLGTESYRDTLPIRPLGTSARIVLLRGGQAQEVPPAARRPLRQNLRFQHLAPGRLRLLSMPLAPASLPSLRIQPLAGAPEGSVLVRTRLPSGRLREHRLPFPTTSSHPVVVPLLDIPSWPLASIEALELKGAQEAGPGPRLLGSIQVRWPTQDTLLSVKNAARLFELASLPPDTRALRIILHGPGGGIPVLLSGRQVSALKLIASPDFAYALKAGLKMGSNTIYLMLEALSEAKNPASLLARAPLLRLHVSLP